MQWIVADVTDLSDFKVRATNNNRQNLFPFSIYVFIVRILNNIREEFGLFDMLLKFESVRIRSSDLDFYLVTSSWS